ncbi:MAG: hypothetical protein HWQ41_13250 [Nostoc sp. NOS(2021)]|uniref:hypothetical protein n=1 Tax=Nostoc sp. NOS(2021) TaxID=2815407 RepID=UPI0025D6DF1C|nr:hypothetical protein [Nostoc sp. NOS(2021)]MBN3896184.1 hypothetical protein [Nostoc sp. NOS(2021)]
MINKIPDFSKKSGICGFHGHLILTVSNDNAIANIINQPRIHLSSWFIQQN